MKNSEIILPSHMSSLSQNIIDNLLETSDDIGNRILACGINPSDNSLYIISGLLDVKVIRPNGKLKPKKAFPCYDGSRIGIIFDNIEDIQTIDSSLALHEGKSCFENTSLFVNDTYLCDLEIESSIGSL